MKRFLLHILYISALLPFWSGCTLSEEEPADSGADNVRLSLNVVTRALPQEGMEVGSGTPDNMHLWVYGSSNDNQNENAYKLLSYRLMTDGLVEGSDIYGNPVHTIKNLDLPEGKNYRKMYFYVVLNSGSVEGLSLDENTTIQQLQETVFTGIVSGKEDNQMLMYGMNSLDINPHKTNYEVGIEVERSVAKMELYFTKEKENGSLTIDDISLTSTVGKGYLVRTGDLSGIYSTSASTSDLLSSGVDITTWSEEAYGNFSEDLSSFQKIGLTNPYLMENPAGKAWDDEMYPDSAYPDVLEQADGDNFYVVTVRYTADGQEKEQSFYLPVIERNHLYRILIRVASAGQLQLQLNVADWKKEEEWNIDFSAPVNTMLLKEPDDAADAPTEEATVTYNNINEEAGAFVGYFKMESPQFVTWKPTLANASAGDYELRVYTNGETAPDEFNIPVTEVNIETNKNRFFKIMVIAKNPNRVGKVVKLGLTYTASWNDEENSLLIINQGNNDGLYYPWTDNDETDTKDDPDIHWISIKQTSN